MFASTRIRACSLPLIASLTLVQIASADDLAEAQALHRSLLTLDTHVDFSLRDFTEERNLTGDLDGVQVDLPKMAAGGLDAAFFVVYTPQGPRNDEAYRQAHQQASANFDAIHRLTGEWGAGRIALATAPEEVSRLASGDQQVALIGVENAYPLGTSLERVDEFYRRGARYMGILHNGHNQFGDSNFPKGDDPHEIHGGLSSLGEQLVDKLNDTGIVIDISHASRKTRLDIIRRSRYPVVDSHSALSAFYNHKRNIDDEVLAALVEKGGVVQIVAFQSYLAATPEKKLDAINELAATYGFPPGNVWTEDNRIFAHFAKASREQAVGYWRGFRELEQNMPHASVSDLVDQVDYVARRFGIDHVGIASDFGGGGGIAGWRDASETHNVTRELVKRGYSKQDIEKIWSGNFLRVWRAVASAAH